MLGSNRNGVTNRTSSVSSGAGDDNARSGTPVRLFTVRTREGRGRFVNPTYDTDDRCEETPPPPFPSSRPNSSSASRSISLPGLTEDHESNNTVPPPDYVECTFPPPTYDDLYASPTRSPKTPKRRNIKLLAKKIIVVLCVLSLAVALLAIGIKHLILNTCSDIMFLVIWCITTGILLVALITIGLVKSLRKAITRNKTITPLLMYMGAVFSLAWFVGGTVSSWDQLRKDLCDQEVVRITFVSCIIMFFFVIFLCCCGQDLFERQHRTQPSG